MVLWCRQYNTVETAVFSATYCGLFT